MNKMILKLALVLLITISTVAAKAQVTVGADVEPNKGALLDLKERVPSSPETDNTTSNNGILYPRVALTDKNSLYPMFENNGSADYKLGGTSYPRVDENRKHAGLVVYNLTYENGFVPGLYVWNGTEWRQVTNDAVVYPVEVSQLFCESAVMVPATFPSTGPVNAILKVPYFGGSGGSYPGAAPVSIGNGLLLERVEGTLSIGGGEILYRITGTPVNTQDALTFPVTFYDKNCNVTVNEIDMNSVNVRNLTADKLINTQYEDTPSNADILPFEEIIIPETGSYAFSLRLYGRIGTTASRRMPFYIYLQRNNRSNVEDCAELDIVTLAQTANLQDYSYSVTLGGYFQAGDKVVISMYRPSLGTWTLYRGSGKTSPIRTSLVYWKL